MDTLNCKLENLKTYIASMGSAAVAFSGGVDSTFLLKTAHDVLGDNLIAITARSCSYPQRELNETIAFTDSENIKHIICESEELEIDGFCNNPTNRCYLCKKELFEKMREIAKEYDITNILEGSNLDDNSDYRPGLQAIRELDIKSPLRYAKLTKEEIRALSKQRGLLTWDKQSFACLSSRFVYGEQITREKLKMVELAEQHLLDLGFHQVRVRIHSNIARIEVLPYEFSRFSDITLRNQIYSKLKGFGFTYVTLDLLGYRTGSMNEILGS
ncbi:Pyridinium-3,5-biscarboxylic acid mononucleotide sulfurtransferase [bioreactor metagenome]|uniref:Pyridinium-3,5-biscarboxylic acid mononucleotide sulfurtransferase n=1 Tax=bioreactor metagenome TaxID=1076179 RepID=A0A644ZIX8_9ZZZZ|nr:ATP-dependent sacrificial sulfur transferase LarE [Candidatus Metalachnospira sp.]